MRVQSQAGSGFGSLNGVKLIEKTGNSVSVEFSVAPSNPYFDGHFPEFSLLPAVAQVELIIRFASEYLETGIDISEMRRVKFTQFILPDTPLFLRLEKDEKIIRFKITSPEDKSLYSSGILTISFREKDDK